MLVLTKEVFEYKKMNIDETQCNLFLFPTRKDVFYGPITCSQSYLVPFRGPTIWE